VSLGANGDGLQLADGKGHVNGGGGGHVSLFHWHYVAFAVDTFQGASTYHFAVDSTVETLTDKKAFASFWENSISIFGAFNQYNNGALSEHFKGFLYAIEGGIYVPALYDRVFTDNAGSLCTCEHDGCPESDACLGICNWNYWFNGVECERCPYWCTEGCQANGSC
jgi:hypothetical protein